ncbi:Uncharacterized protein T310_6518 [Rasamsonia emersonii CBS 393.64]|uniref:EthD domain-containing protein n=1 Tax=Rasamsonia emersonii (strain ATCC 16479 / CBS 393.64 / IMI 116815) TaxID=1408163 RepID=A0A0F4YNS6_RASE3|nr:Uncharacterized protein T310_6518 [Rasamsonia emersonii CBS 393.64]KKA19511.1 Uncharacterized protein T310_6518 [Rasamsonia emersonii CBS 393.64]
MTYRILAFLYRKPSISPDEFKQHYEANHIPLLKRLTGPDFPLTHTRRYIARKSVDQPVEGASERNAKTPATVFVGSQADFDYDAVVELTFADEAAFQAFHAKLTSPEVAKELGEDEERFINRAKLRVVALGDVVETAK